MCTFTARRTLTPQSGAERQEIVLLNDWGYIFEENDSAGRIRKINWTLTQVEMLMLF